ncbi:cell division protein FtsL [Maritimibacter dapengensis]|uniref:Cell division protein FtsL n=1 Tax=Maritimibacter dapengensis TaxID=2836868 RepID=A0ABS6T1N7_9RHOB|nr:cell division protein FtsL [Maritimibacter dapengensis]MBV7379004.1 cell division protein FtsL [Maritimibacter dapengensis]
MRTLLFVMSTMIVMALGYWAYHENYKTQAVLDDVEDLQRDIGAKRERLAVLRAEWAYLNRPDRLRELAAMNFDRLGLFPLSPEQFGKVDQIAFPEEPDPLSLLPPAEAIDVQAALDMIEDLPASTDETQE